MCFPCALNANTLLIQFNIYFCHKQHAAIEYKGDFPACIITIIIFPFLDVLYWEVMPSLRVESWQSAGTLALEYSATLQWFSHLTSKTKKTPPKTQKNQKKKGVEQDRPTKRQELSELHTTHILLRPYLNTSASPLQKHEDISLQTLSLPTEAREETHM